MNQVPLAQWLQQYGLACLVLAPFALGAFILLRRVVLRGVAKPGGFTAPLWRKAATGLALAAAVLVPCIAIPAVLGLYNPAHPGWVAFDRGAVTDSGLAYSGMFIVQSLAEELFFRGIALALLGTLFYWQAALLLAPGSLRLDRAQPAAVRWYRRAWLGSGALASAVVSVAFGAVHADNPSFTPLSLCNIGLAGFALGLVFWLQGDLSGAWAMHWLWNTLQVLFGLPVSGNILSGPALGFGAQGAVPGVMTGGSFGPEGSILCTLTLLLVSAWLLWQGWRATIPDVSG